MNNAQNTPATEPVRRQISDVKYCFFSPSKTEVLHGAYLHENGLHFSFWSGETLAQVQAKEGADVVVLDIAEGWQRQENKYITEPAEITEEKYDYALNVLPPGRWTTRGGASSFHCIEMWSGNISTISVQIGERFYQYLDRITLTHEQRVEKCLPLHNAPKK